MYLETSKILLTFWLSIEIIISLFLRPATYAGLSFLTLLFGRFLGKKGACFLTTGCVLTSAFLSFFIFYEVALCGSTCCINLLP